MKKIDFEIEIEDERTLWTRPLFWGSLNLNYKTFWSQLITSYQNMATISKWYLYFDGKQGSDYLPEYLFSHLLIPPLFKLFCDERKRCE